LGFKKLNQVVTVVDTPSNRGMINKISDMVEIIES
jgi:large subunit ribosomal protein L30